MALFHSFLWLGSIPLLEKEMATHSSVLAWRVPRTAEPGGLPSMGSHRVGHDWSDLAAAAAFHYIYMYHIFFTLSFKLFTILFHHLFPLPCCVFIYSTNIFVFPLCIRHWWYSGKQDIYSVSKRRWGCDDGKEWVLGLKRVSGRTPEILNMNSQPGAFLTLAKHVWIYTPNK